MLKKTTIAVLGIAANSFVLAGSMDPVCTPGNVTVPCEAKLWDLGVEALYLRSLYSANKDYQLRPAATTGGNLTYNKVSNDWDWGYRLMGAYHFNTGNDVTVNWMHFSTSANQGNILGPLPFSVFGISTVPADLSSQDRLDQVNIVMGQHVDLGLRDKMRFYAGMQYANIQSTTQTYLITPFLTPILDSSLNIFDNTNYQGFGPNIGIDYSYDIIGGLSVTANGSGSILYGTTRYHEGFVLSSFNAIYSQVFARKKAIVPSIEAKLGLNYAYNLAQGVLNIDAGYQAVNYFNALNAQMLQNPNALIHSVDYGLYGPYFGLKYVGNA